MDFGIYTEHENVLARSRSATGQSILGFVVLKRLGAKGDRRGGNLDGWLDGLFGIAELLHRYSPSFDIAAFDNNHRITEPLSQQNKPKTVFFIRSSEIKLRSVKSAKVESTFSQLNDKGPTPIESSMPPILSHSNGTSAEKLTSHALHEGVHVASRIETKAALHQLAGGKRELQLLARVPFHQQETAAYLTRQLRICWLAANNARLTEVADLLERAIWECSRPST